MSPLTVTDWVLTLTLVRVYALYPGLSTRGRARARGEFCVVHRRQTAMLVWKLKKNLNGDRLNFEINICSGECFGMINTEVPTRERARLGSSALSTIAKSPYWSGN